MRAASRCATRLPVWALSHRSPRCVTRTATWWNSPSWDPVGWTTSRHTGPKATTWYPAGASIWAPERHPAIPRAVVGQGLAPAVPEVDDLREDLRLDEF